MMKVVLAAFLLAKVTPSAVVHLSKVWPVGAVPAVMVTSFPAAAAVLSLVPFSTVTAHVCSATVSTAVPVLSSR